MSKAISGEPKRFYGKHFAAGVVNYPEHDESMLLVTNAVAKEMDKTFEGRPLYVNHVDQIEYEEADGWVIKSFYEPLDGCHWAEFLAVTDEAKDKIKDGWKLSNSYNITEFEEGGFWHNIEYASEVKSGKYDHLSLVDNPRYEESIILTPEEFKAYQNNLRNQIESVKNSKGDKPMFFKKAKVTKLDNEKEISELSVTLPKSKVEKTVTQLINEADAIEVARDEKKYAADSDLVKIGEEEISVSELVAKLNELMTAIEAGASDEEESDESEEELNEVANADGDDEDDKDNAADDEEKDKKKDNKKSSVFTLAKAAKKPLKNDKVEAPKRVSLKDQIALGKKLY